MVDEAIVKSVQTYLRTLIERGMDIRFGVIFGSYARGCANEFSDIDLLVVSPEFDGIVEREKISRLWRIAARSDSRIEPIPCGTERWEKDDANPIIEIARQEGQAVNA
ncbi:MAG: nucleotidyltransferase domain-containing protein [Sedimentisphaerales bacterium]|nr:nucleotidyltransferase domain-containing protein [Sedimentisphaerales bacterium]